MHMEREREMEIETDMELYENCRSSMPLPLPPRLEDAGLEDCALSAEGIREAFFRAAQAVKSTASTILDKDNEGHYVGECIEDGGPSNGEWTDSLQDYSHIPKDSGGGQSCVVSLAGGFVEQGTDKLVGIGIDIVEGDQIVDGEKPGKHLGEDDGVCVPGLKGVPGSRVEKDENGKEEEAEGPTLAETYA